ncbi:hypothetical protein [Octadecabacter ascidiaceicola]|uniref:DUF2059 domain-containing protein n=1 Tax=Octadecabacter ascidiaceicola TaxID=1655543 RepID=A0A238JLP1_9RHOB|nr:hypothetical protein [Octadecabacter ascidiaceicola]SMX31087.1 hypothetical protein OCA8868_00183 [Octadecabacter ascidiaceicola]
MSSLCRAFILAVFLPSMQTAFAAPYADAQLIIQRSTGAEWDTLVEQTLRAAFVQAYFGPISDRSVRIADGEAFAALIPNEEVAPYEDQMRAVPLELMMHYYSADQLASIAAIMRIDETATLEDIKSNALSERAEAALAQARADAQVSGADDAATQELEALTAQLNAFSAMVESGLGESMAQDIGVGMGALTKLMSFSREISQLERHANNPVTIAAIETDGVLAFSNPVQHRSLLREITSHPAAIASDEGATAQETGGIRFIRPPVQ